MRTSPNLPALPACRPASGGVSLISALAALALLAGCSAGNARAQPGADDVPRAIPVEIARADRGTVTATWSGTAAVVVDREATVVARVGGEITEILVEEGDRVAAGDVLARLDGDRLRLEMEEAEANFRRLERDLERNRTLAERGLISAEALDILEYEVASMRAAYERRALEYEYTRIRAPFDGVVAERLVRVGNNLSTEAATFRITGKGPLLAYLHVPEREYARISRGQPATIRVDALGGETLDGEVIRISPVMDPDSGTFRVTVEFRDPENRLRPGMFGRVAVVHERREDALLIPRTALLDSDGADAVFRVNDGHARRTRITTGHASGDRIEVLDGLEPGERVVVGQGGLRDGARVGHAHKLRRHRGPREAGHPRAAARGPPSAAAALRPRQRADHAHRADRDRGPPAACPRRRRSERAARLSRRRRPAPAAAHLRRRAAQAPDRIGRLEQGAERLLVRAVKEFRSVDEMADAIVAVRDRQPVYLRDVATVSRGHREREAITRVGGEESIELGLYREGDANTVRTAAAAHARLDALRRDLPDNVELTVINDQSVFIASAIRQVQSAALVGGLLAVLLLYGFLRDLRATVVIGRARSPAR